MMANSGFSFFQLDSKSIQINGKSPTTVNNFKSGPETLRLGDIQELYSGVCDVPMLLIQIFFS